MSTVRDLIADLERLINKGLIHEDSEVRMAYQPHYPLWAQTGNITPGTADGRAVGFPSECEECGCDPQEEGFTHYNGCEYENQPGNYEDPQAADYVYITESGWDSGYASKALWSDVEEWS